MFLTHLRDEQEFIVMQHHNVTAKFERGVTGEDPIFSKPTPHVAFVGRSNVGKSSMINTLTGVRGLAREGDTPGKTKEINFYATNVKKYIVDLPGYGFAEGSLKDRVELKQRIEWYISESKAPIEKIVLMVDAVAGLTELDENMLQILHMHAHPLVIVINKIDKCSQSELYARQKAVHDAAPNAAVFLCSTRTGLGIEKLKTALFF